MFEVVWKRRTMMPIPYVQPVETWGLRVSGDGELMIDNVSLVHLAHEFGTPLHVLHEQRLENTVRSFVEAARSAYRGKVSVHYPFKCNGVPAVIDIMKRMGVNAEVMTEFELELALAMGYEGNQMIVNGPCKSDDFIVRCLGARVRFLVVDSLDELHAIDRLTQQTGIPVNLLLRINPDYVPRGINRGSATGSRKHSAFGLDLKGEEVRLALRLIKDHRYLRFWGFHFHIGTGIRDPQDYSNAFRCLRPLRRLAQDAGLPVRVVDVGGGFAAMPTKEFTTAEMLLYEGLGRLPHGPNASSSVRLDRFLKEIPRVIEKEGKEEPLPELIYEPGRCLVSSNQMLLLAVHRIKERRGAGRWLITDGGLGTVTLPTYYEYHEVLLCNDVYRPRTEKVHIIGPACFAGDVVYRNKWMPRVNNGEILALMDTGAYFIPLESSFGFARPAIVGVCGDDVRLLRRRETTEEWVMRDVSAFDRAAGGNI